MKSDMTDIAMVCLNSLNVIKTQPKILLIKINMDFRLKRF